MNLRENSISKRLESDRYFPVLHISHRTELLDTVSVHLPSRAVLLPTIRNEDLPNPTSPLPPRCIADGSLPRNCNKSRSVVAASKTFVSASVQSRE